MIFQPALPWLWLVLAVVLVAAGVGWTLARGVRLRSRAVALGVFRLLALAVLCVMLAQPQRRQDDVVILRPQIAVLIDNSESMRDPADSRQPLRMEQVKKWLASPALARARKDFDVRTFGFDQGTEGRAPEGLTYDGKSSNLTGAVTQLEERFRGQPLAAVLVLSDGLDTGGSVVSSTIPIDTFELERPFTPPRSARRITLANVDFPLRVVVGWDTEVHAKLNARGMSGRTVAVELWRNGRKLSETAAPFNADDQTREVAFPISEDRPGLVAYELRVNDPAADHDAKSHPFVIEVLETGNHVLYVQNSLGFDFKFLRKAIVSDRNLQLSAYVRWADGRVVNIADSGGSPVALDFSPEGLAKQAVVILGDLPAEALSQAQWKGLRDFVDHGGGLVLLGGPNSMASPDFAKNALGELLPVKVPAPYVEGSFAVEITDAGLHHPVFGSLFAQVKDFPALLTCNVPEAATPAAEVLMNANVHGTAVPLIVARRFGQGRVITVLTDTIWRWRLAARGWEAEHSPYDTFWTQLMDWLIPKERGKQENEMNLFTERPVYLAGERPEVRAILRASGSAQPAVLPLQVRTPDGKTFDYQMKSAMLQTSAGERVPGYRVEVEPTEPGIYSASSKTTVAGVAVEGETHFVVKPPATEITGKPIDRELLAGLAEKSGGHFYPIDRWDGWRADLHYPEQHFSRVRLVDLWNQPVVLGLFMAMLAMDWTLRKIWNLP